jgi:16S rRNA (guanine527-N7)-methyltransferase
MVLKLHVDSALLANLMELPSPLLDLGTGAGFPGIPLKIMRPDLHVVLAEPRAKRVGFLREAVATLGLRDVEIVPHRIGKRFDRDVAGIVTRAVEPIADTLARVEPWVRPGARVILMKGPSCQEEIDTALELHGDAYDLTLDRAYEIPGTDQRRRLVVFDRRAPVRAHRSVAPASATSTTRHAVRDIASADNATFKELRALHTGRGVRKRGLALVSGARHVTDVLRDFPDACVAWLSPDEPPPAGAPAHLEWYRPSPHLFRQVDVTGTGPPLLVIRVPAIEPWSNADWPPGCTLFVPFQDPENVGAVIRSGAAFGVTRVVLLESAAHPFHPRSVRAAGATPLLRVPLLAGPAIADLHPTGAPLVALSPAGEDIDAFEFPPVFGLLPGIEGPGLPAAGSWTPLRIPMQPGVESLNAATATAIALHRWYGATPHRDPKS